ncbi:hypothetical protein HPB50_026604 [Hyalomma asiaticum]|uniref:Uncharacterized protein n=1 Tax=Hyalomma asiaticum TaxID=266040 RepID=A0ACB7TP61_HYAAI|nr:hypothetical protein HPB50_026604 [Hyalomma asiaticum]
MADGGDARALPLGWEERLSQSTGEVYYLNLLTNERQWNFPEQPADAGYVRPDGSIQCSHILVKHCESRRPFSWRLGLDKKITRTRDEALELIKFCRGVILTGRKTFGEMAEEYSDCVSAKRKGDLNGRLVAVTKDLGTGKEDTLEFSDNAQRQQNKQVVLRERERIVLGFWAYFEGMVLAGNGVSHDRCPGSHDPQQQDEGCHRCGTDDGGASYHMKLNIHPMETIRTIHHALHSRIKEMACVTL